MPAPPTSDENKSAGILLAVLAFALFSMMDVAVKMLVSRYSVPQVIATQGLFAMVPVLGYAAYSGGIFRNIRTRRIRLHFVRSLCGLSSGFLGFYAYSQLPIADVYALAFSAPLFITALSVPILGEKVGWRRWTAVAAGFVGVLVMLRPGSGLLNPAALAAVGAALFYSLGMLIARFMRGTETSVSFAFYSTLAGITVYGAMMPWLGVVPSARDLALSAFSGTIAGIAIICLLTAFRKAPASVVAPFQYTQMVWGILYGYVFFQSVPDRWLFIGGAIVIGSGLYILYRETQIGRQVAAPRVPE